LIGCCPRYVRTLIRQGKLVPVVRDVDYGYDVSVEEVRKFLSRPQGRGWPRGKPRN
jgi:hypothetical protein